MSNRCNLYLFAVFVCVLAVVCEFGVSEVLWVAGPGYLSSDVADVYSHLQHTDNQRLLKSPILLVLAARWFCQL